MSLAYDLLDQAAHLAKREPRRPKQASLRRAVSTAYFALFHHLVDEASRLLISGPSRNALRSTIRRAFAHRTMKEASEGFRDGKVGRQWSACVGQLPSDLRIVAAAFVDLQQARHDADYDITRTFTRKEVNTLVIQCREALAGWKRCKGDANAETYLAALLLYKRLPH